jgi:hypothetical protein
MRRKGGERFPPERRAMIIRTMAVAELARLGDIDRSEAISQIYHMQHGALVAEAVQIQAPPWPPEKVAGFECELADKVGTEGGLWGAFAGATLAGIAALEGDMIARWQTGGAGVPARQRRLPPPGAGASSARLRLPAGARAWGAAALHLGHPVQLGGRVLHRLRPARRNGWTPSGSRWSRRTSTWRWLCKQAPILTLFLLTSSFGPAPHLLYWTYNGP